MYNCTSIKWICVWHAFVVISCCILDAINWNGPNSIRRYKILKTIFCITLENGKLSTYQCDNWLCRCRDLRFIIGIEILEILKNESLNMNEIISKKCFISKFALFCFLPIFLKFPIAGNYYLFWNNSYKFDSDWMWTF